MESLEIEEDRCSVKHPSSSYSSDCSWCQRVRKKIHNSDNQEDIKDMKHKCKYEPMFIIAECKCGHKCAVEIEENSKELITLKKTYEEKNTKPIRRSGRKS